MSKINPVKKTYEEEINGVKFKMIHVPGGSVIIEDRTITVPDFHIAETPCTQALWRAVMGEDPDRLAFKGDQRPVEGVSWDDIVNGTKETDNISFLKNLNENSKYSNYKLPSEAMWQFAAQGGDDSEGYEFVGSNNLKEVGWYNKNSHFETKPVKLKLPNELGIYDMSGNVWEWCADVWDEDGKNLPLDGSLVKYEKNNNIRSVRGGSWVDFQDDCRLAIRVRLNTGFRDSDIGFRISRY